MDSHTKHQSQSIAIKIIKYLILIYTYISIPFYYAIQQPWRVLERAHKPRARLENPADPYSAWVRYGQSKPHYLDECKTIPEATKKLFQMNAKDRQCLGYRKILTEEDVNVSGKVIKKWVLSNYQWLTLAQVDQKIKHISRGLLINGVKPKDIVLIISDTRLEWYLSAQAIVRIGAAITTLYPTLGTEGFTHGINELKVTHIITTEDLLPKLAKLQKQIPTVKTIIFIELEYKQIPKVDFAAGINLQTFKQVEIMGRMAPKNLNGLSPIEDDIAIIQYTSGSTGVPKGVILTHKQIVQMFQTSLTLNYDSLTGPKQHTYIAYLPLSHALEFSAVTFFFSCGVRIGYGTPYTLTNTGTALKPGVKGDINLLQPTHMACVPLILNRIRKDIEVNVAKKGTIFKDLFDFVINYKIDWQLKGYRTPIIDYFVCNTIRSQLGGQLEYVFIGGAPISPDTHQFLSACLNIRLSQCFGCTETTAGALGMDFDDRTCGRVGSPLFGIKVRLLDWKEGGYRVTDKPNSRGEAVIGGDSVAIGYYGLDELTAESFEVKDGIRWFKSGDIFEVNADGLFKVIDRKKDFVKLQFGEYISLEKVESVMKICRFVDNICVYGDSYCLHLIALIIPNPTALKELAQQVLNVPETVELEELCNNKEIIEYVRNELGIFGTSFGLHKREIPAQIKLCSEEWTTNNALVTPALKIRRKNIQNFYQADIDALYGKI